MTKPPIDTDTPWGKLPPCRGHAFEEDQMTPANDQASPSFPPVRYASSTADSFCDRVLGPRTSADYAPLRAVLDAAHDHAARGKGNDRHANGRAFVEQPMMKITRDVGPGFPLGQAMKKAQEAGGMIDRGELRAAEAECLGAINYLAGAIIWMREQTGEERKAA